MATLGRTFSLRVSSSITAWYGVVFVFTEGSVDDREQSTTQPLRYEPELQAEPVSHGSASRSRRHFDFLLMLTVLLISIVAAILWI
jgi:hypothetical protein